MVKNNKENKEKGRNKRRGKRRREEKHLLGVLNPLSQLFL
jgi:hypothetical protein